MARLNFSSLIETPLSKAQQVAGFLNKNIPFGRNNRTQLEMDRVLTRGANVNGDQLDFATQNEELIEAQQMGPQPQSMGDRVLSGLKDIASRPETYRNLATIGSILASAQGEQNLANTLSTVSNRIDQGIVREENKAILAADSKRKEEEKEKNQLVKLLESENKEQNKQIQDYKKFIRDQKSKGVSLVKEGDRLSKIPDQFKQEFTNPETGKKQVFIDRKGLSKRKEETDRTIAYRKNIINKNNRLLKNVLGKLITTDKEGNTVFTEVGSEMTTNPVKKGFDRVFSKDFRDMEGLLKTLKANLGFDQLQAMRDASPTGGALGQVSERELDFLQSAAGALDIGMSKENLINSLAEIKKSLERLNKEQNINYDSVFMGEEIQGTENVGFRRVE